MEVIIAGAGLSHLKISGGSLSNGKYRICKETSLWNRVIILAPTDMHRSINAGTRL